jgi:hypothetical protein
VLRCYNSWIDSFSGVRASASAALLLDAPRTLALCGWPYVGVVQQFSPIEAPACVFVAPRRAAPSFPYLAMAWVVV